MSRFKLGLFSVVTISAAFSASVFNQTAEARSAKVTATEEIKCGSVISKNTQLNRDLDCRDYLGAALIVSGSNVTLDGRGYKIFAHQEGLGLHVRGDNVTIKNLQIGGATNGRGIYAEAGKKLKIQNNNIDGNMIGIHLFANVDDVERAQITNNSIQDSSQIAILISSSGDADVISPVMKQNDFSRTNGTAIHANAAKLRLTDAQNNIFDGSRNAVYFSGKKLVIQQLDLSESPILESMITLVGAEDVTIRNSNLSSILGISSSGTRMGINAYKVQQLTVQNSIINNQDVAIKVATEQNVQTTLRVRNSEIQGTSLAGVMIQSYDQTEFGTVRVQGNSITNSLSNLTVWVVGNTVLGPKSKILL